MSSSPSLGLPPSPPASDARAAGPGAPSLFNGATTHGIWGQKGIRHPWEMPLFFIGAAIMVLAYLLWIALIVMSVVNLVRGTGPTIFTVRAPWDQMVAQLFAIVMLVPIALWIMRAYMYAQMRAVSTRMSPTQFPQGYRMVAEAARHYGLRRVPDAYVQLGNGTINAFASGHGFRRFVVVYSDLFEVGGQVRDPDALRFVIAHEVGHLAAGHVSYFRLLFSNLMMQIPLLGPALSRAQEYTADNFGYTQCPQGAAGTMAVLAAGKYLNADVNVNELADRAFYEKGLWLHLVNWQSSHPITTWRAHALRDRRRAGKIWFRPGSPFWRGTPANGPMFAGPLPPASSFSRTYPTPEQALAMLDAADAQRPAGLGNQFGRFPGVDYSAEPSVREVQTAQPLLSQPVAPSPPQS